MAKKTRCPACKESFELEAGLEVGNIIDCPSCSAELKVFQLDPVELEEEASNWDDYADEGEREF